MTRSPPSVRDGPAVSAVIKRIASVAFGILALAGLLFAAWPRGDSLSALSTEDLDCGGDDRGSSSHIIRHLEAPTDVGFARINHPPKFLMEVETSKGPGWRDWSQYTIDIRDRSHRLLRAGTGYTDSQPRIFGTKDQQYLLFTAHNRTLYKIDWESGNRIPLLALPDRLDDFYVYDVL